MVTTCAAWARRKRSPGGTAFALMMMCIVLWGVTAGMAAATPALAEKLLFSKLGYVGICGVAPLFLRFSLAYAGRDGLSRKRAARHTLLWAVPAATLVLVFTNEGHHLVWTGFTPVTNAFGTFLVYGHGPWYWAWLAWYAAASAVALVLLVHGALLGPKAYLGQTIIFIAGALMPWAGEILALSRM